VVPDGVDAEERMRLDINSLPYTDRATLGPDHCCAPFDPAKWDRLELQFRDKRFVRVKTAALLHIPLNMSKVFVATRAAIAAAEAEDSAFIILTDDESLWCGVHYFAVSEEVPGLDNVTLSGRFVTRVFEGPYRDAYVWVREMKADFDDAGCTMGRLFFFYATCPRCAERLGKNYTVAVAEVV
jgi:hypothetical protein